MLPSTQISVLSETESNISGPTGHAVDAILHIFCRLAVDKVAHRRQEWYVLQDTHAVPAKRVAAHQDLLL